MNEKTTFNGKIPMISHLRGKKSVRTTFKVTPENLEFLKRKEEEFKITAKELLDEYIKGCPEKIIELSIILFEKVLKKEYLEFLKNNLEKSVRKSFVLSSDSIDILNNNFKYNNFDRDSVFNSIIFCHRIIEIEYSQKRQEFYFKYFNYLDETFEKFCEIEKEGGDIFDSETFGIPVSDFSASITYLGDFVGNLSDYREFEIPLDFK